MQRMMNMTKLSLSELQEISKRVRKDIINMIYKAGSGHPGGSLSATEILAALYFEIMKDEDRFFLSNGHICPALYAVMAEKGLIEKSLLSTYTELGSVLQGHPERTKLEGIMNTSGPLGLGLAQAVGYSAIKKDLFVYCMTSDAEHQEGNHWEAVNFAAKYKLSNLIQIVDRNKVQIEGSIEQIMPLGDLKGKYIASNWNVLEIDGHDFDQIFLAVEKAKGEKSKPTVIIANTIFGKGISFMENNPDYHAKTLTEEEYTKAMEELK